MSKSDDPRNKVKLYEYMMLDGGPTVNDNVWSDKFVYNCNENKQARVNGFRKSLGNFSFFLHKGSEQV